MMLIQGINDNILIPHLSYLGVFQDEAKKLHLYKEINVFWGLEPNPQKTDKTGVHVSLSTLSI